MRGEKNEEEGSYIAGENKENLVLRRDNTKIDRYRAKKLKEVYKRK